MFIPPEEEQIRVAAHSHITQNWRGRPLVSHEVIVNLIASTTTQAGLKIRAELDTHWQRVRVALERVVGKRLAPAS